MATFLLELRTEEIPANALPSARTQLAEGLVARLADVGFADVEIRALSTSRRLVAVVSGLPDRQPDRTERIIGPPVRIAFDGDGHPTKAAEGFARKVGVAVEALEREETDKGGYLAATVTHVGRPTGAILGELVPAVIGALRFPKTMRWGLGRHVFVRPVHGLVALLDEEVVPMSLLGVEAGRETVGHRVHAPEAIRLRRADDLVGALAEAQVIVDPERRRRMLDEQATRLAADVSCRVHPDPDLMAEHVELVEYPGLLRGAIDEAFLQLPREVVVTTLRHHQKCLILETGDGELAPHFLAVVDRADDPEGLIRQGNEWVIGARLADARFFFDEDRRRRFEDLVPRLERLEFHRVLGSVAAKARRVGDLAVAIAEAGDIDPEGVDLGRAAALVKADLLTHMVGEFPELQGVMGGHYLRLEGEPEALWTAARDHYLPLGFEGRIPSSNAGRLLAVADRLDTVAGLFAVGEVPTGSKDPFGLRRACQGAVRTIAEAGWDVDLGEAIAGAARGVAAVAEADAGAVAGQVEEFVADRVRRYLADVLSLSFDTVDAVMAAGWHRLPDLVARARALEEMRTEPELRSLALAAKRVRNIVEGQPDVSIRPELLAEPAERDLHDAGRSFHAALGPLLEARNVTEAFAAMGELAEVLDRFFIEVLVMCDDERIRDNRIALLRMLGRDFLTLADLSKLQIEGGE